MYQKDSQACCQTDKTPTRERQGYHMSAFNNNVTVCENAKQKNRAMYKSKQLKSPDGSGFFRSQAKMNEYNCMILLIKFSLLHYH